MSNHIDYTKGKLLYKGKAKSIYATEHDQYTVMSFRDDVSAYNGIKLEQLSRKGQINNYFNAFIMEKLEAAGIPTHFIRLINPTESLVRCLKMLPLESVVRNRAAGGLVRRYGLEEGIALIPPTQEFFYKSDELNDPILNDSIMISLGYASQEHINEIKRLSTLVNDTLMKLFDNAGIILVDFKLEFGLVNDQIVLGDEFSPDGCRLWDKKTLEKLDKDRFRQDLGGVVEAYESVANRLGVPDYFPA